MKQIRSKNGFTLIELLAIIVILAIIAVITVPIILNIIDNSRKGAATDSAYGYKDSVQKYYLSNVVNDTTQELPTGVKNVATLKTEGLTVSGEEPSEGWVKLEKGQVVDYSLKFGDYVVNYDNSTNSTIATKNGSLKEEPSNEPFITLVDDVDEDGEISVGDEYTIGDEHFYVISTNGNETVLITKYNLLVGQNVSYEVIIGQGVNASSFNYEAISSETEGYGMQSSEAVSTSTPSGSSILVSYKAVIDFSESNYWYDSTNSTLKSSYGNSYPAYIYDSNSKLYTYVNNYKNSLESLGATIKEARLITYEEATSTDLGCTSSSNSCESWMSNSSFWTGSANNTVNTVWLVNKQMMSAFYSNNETYGVRPVIVVNTSDID